MTGNPIFLSVLISLGVAVTLLGIYQVRRSAELRRRINTAFEAPVQTYERMQLQIPLRERILAPIWERILGLAGRMTPTGNVDRLKHDLVVAGNPKNMTVLDFMGLKLLSAVTVGAVVAFVLILQAMNSFAAVLLGVGAGAVGLLLPNYWLNKTIKARKKEIMRSMPDALDMLTICVDAGLGFDAALMKVSQRWDGALSKEFRRVIGEIRMGARRQEALRNMATRTDVPEVSSFVAVLVQADSLGVSITDVLHAQSEQMRMRRRQWAEEQARKAPLKMLIPLVMCIFPALFAVILGPAVPRIARAFGSL